MVRHDQSRLESDGADVSPCPEFYSIGALFAIYGTGVLLISLYRRQQGNKQFFSEIGEDGLNQRKFRTSGNVVVVLTALSVAAYGCLMGLTLKLGS